MNFSFEKQVALVTGAASGMGLAAAQAFAAGGAAREFQWQTQKLDRTNEPGRTPRFRGGAAGATI